MKKYIIVILLISIFIPIAIIESKGKTHKELELEALKRGATIGAVTGGILGSGLYGGSSLRGAGFGATIGYVGGALGAIGYDTSKAMGVTTATATGALIGYGLHGNEGILPGAIVGSFGSFGGLAGATVNAEKRAKKNKN